ncbi:unnamed protein product [Mytilus edulis]|uniref:Uncharacterized protein n=1 Tax=Mytilus edulis TaxID=6550 RepID=A0A8S3REQ8_MYTED|nr:unnamed protein product [Mytilus edulis]
MEHSKEESPEPEFSVTMDENTHDTSKENISDANNNLEKSELSNINTLLHTSLSRVDANLVDALEKINTYQQSNQLKNTEDTNTVTSYQKKISELQKVNQSLELQLKIERNNVALNNANFESALQHERSLVSNLRKELESVITTSTKEILFNSDKNEAKNQEITELTKTVKELNMQVSHLQDENMSIKSQLANLYDDQINRRTNTNPDKTEEKKSIPDIPTALMVGTSNLKGINEKKITPAVEITKVIAFTIDQAKDDNNYVPVFDTYQSDRQILLRNSNDTKVNTRGKDLIDLCISHQLRFLNGRIIGDLFGKYTCYKPVGASVVDYAIMSESALNQVLYFKVNDFIPTLSDCHSKIEWKMSAHFTTTHAEVIDNILPLSCNYVWSDDSSDKFQDALSSIDIQKMIFDFEKSTIQNSPDSVNTAAIKLSNIFINAADKSLRKPRPKKDNKKQLPQNNWFDNDLKKMRINLLIIDTEDISMSDSMKIEVPPKKRRALKRVMKKDKAKTFKQKRNLNTSLSSLSKSFNRSVTSRVIKQTLQSNNRQLAMTLEKTRKDLRMASNVIMDQKREIIGLQTQVTTYKHLAGLKPDEIENEVQIRMEV